MTDPRLQQDVNGDLLPLRLPLVSTQANRGTSDLKDAKLVNGFVETTATGELYCYKRPGIAIVAEVAGTSSAGGIYYWAAQIWTVFAANLYRDTTLVGAVASSAVNPYSFGECLGATPVLFLHNSSNAYTVTAVGVLAAVVDPDYPASTVLGVVYIDGTTYVMTPQAEIRGSAINDPSAWDPLNSIFAQIDPDAGIAIAKQQNYLIAFKEYSVEVFFDAGNAAGSPLGRMEAAKLSVGCAGAQTVDGLDGDLFWVGKSRHGSYNVMMMKGLKAEEISSPAINRLLSQDASIAAAQGLAFQSFGHKFYLLNLIGVTEFTGSLLYDIGEKVWYEWRGPDGLRMPLFDCANGAAYVNFQHSTNGDICQIDPNTWTDLSQLYDWDLYTPNFDGGNRLKKVCSLMEIAADQQVGGRLDCRFSDDDYHTWSGFRTFDLGLSRPLLPNWGTFRRRAHHFHFRQNLALRVKAVDLHIDLGSL